MSFLNAALVNNPFEDPGVYLEFKHRHQALLFDLGDLHNLPARKILKVDHIFVSHTHMDHFIGFDHLVRICLGRNRHIALFGPPGFIQDINHRLRAYTWNLVGQYTNDFILDVTELHPGRSLQTARFECRKGFAMEAGPDIPALDGLLTQNQLFSVRAACLDHKIPSLAFCFEERRHLNIMKSALLEMNLPTGPWLNDLKEHILRGTADEEPIRAWWRNGEGKVSEAYIPLGTLRDRVIKTTPGHRIAYVTDAVFSADNVGKIVELAAGAELLFIETTFPQEDREQAAAKHHLTAGQAGAIARMAGVKRLIPFHFSPKYRKREGDMVREAMEAFTSADGWQIFR